jgi:hypothetical protein
MTIKALLFTSVGPCNQACVAINNNQRQMAIDNGYTIAGDGSIIGKDAAGNDMPGAQGTLFWDKPRQVGTGTTTPAGSFAWWIVDPRPVRGDASMAGVVGWTAGEYQPSDAAGEV